MLFEGKYPYICVATLVSMHVNAILKGQSHGQTEKLQRPENALGYQNIDKIITLR